MVCFKEEMLHQDDFINMEESTLPSSPSGELRPKGAVSFVKRRHQSSLLVGH